MSVTSVEKDVDTLTLTMVAEFGAPVERVWELWADPRKLERWWGPPTHPATMERHELAPGGEVAYYMTAPDGERFRGWWRIEAVDPPSGIDFTDGFADADGNPSDELPTTAVKMRLTEQGGGTRMELVSTFDDRAKMEQVLSMGAAEGMEQAINQMDALLAG
jgi:uncharacterized protein YndB with AHSA1/START domain